MRIKSQGNELLVEGDEKGAEIVGQVFEQLGALHERRLLGVLRATCGSPPSSSPGTRGGRLRDYLMKSARARRQEGRGAAQPQPAPLPRADRRSTTWSSASGPRARARPTSRWPRRSPACSTSRWPGSSWRARGRGGREAGLPARRPAGEGRSLPAAALRRALRPDGATRRSRGSSSATRIEVAPIAFMRGRTLSDAFVIIDEAQNTTTEQMKMVLTRIGFGSKVVVTGDITQIDLPAGQDLGAGRGDLGALGRSRASPSRTSTRRTWCATSSCSPSSRPTSATGRPGPGRQVEASVAAIARARLDVVFVEPPAAAAGCAARGCARVLRGRPARLRVCGRGRARARGRRRLAAAERDATAARTSPPTCCRSPGAGGEAEASATS